MGPLVAFGLIPVIMAFVAGFVFLTVSEGDITEATAAMKGQIKTTGILSLAGVVVCAYALIQGITFLVTFGIAMSAPLAFVLGTCAAAHKRQ
ncbi:MAG: hypothetical protein VX730_07570 [Pseudomonadota bacterium]|nr:hypothetical protein [Pseudomonadota bacterium]